MSFPLRIVRSNRRTLAIEIDRDAQVIVRSPRRLSDKEILKFVDEKRDWIQKNIMKSVKEVRKRPNHSFEDGELHWYLGEQYHLITSVISRRSVDFDGAFYFHPSVKSKRKDILLKWYKLQAKRYIRERTPVFAKLMKTDFSDLRISSAKTRWGSCGPKNSLNFNWRLIMSPADVFDAIIVHELAHTKHKNHGVKFWELVQKHAPNHKVADHWLRDHRVHLEALD
jgi:Predicted metal-dependent hydrolase